MNIGEKINRMTLLEKMKGKYSLFKCDCGTIKMANRYQVEHGYIKSCGCISKEHPAHTKHGLHGTRLYSIWKAMRERCNTRTCTTYKNYGAKGITICSEWDDFSVFMKWAMANGYEDHLTIDRIDVTGNYEPKNCRWATYKEQANNKGNNKRLTFRGTTKTIAEWADETGISASLISYRLKRKWDVEDALTIPCRYAKGVT